MVLPVILRNLVRLFLLRCRLGARLFMNILLFQIIPGG
jgi:hypothetical protein